MIWRCTVSPPTDTVFMRSVVELLPNATELLLALVYEPNAIEASFACALRPMAIASLNARASTPNAIAPVYPFSPAMAFEPIAIAPYASLPGPINAPCVLAPEPVAIPHLPVCTAWVSPIDFEIDIAQR